MLRCRSTHQRAGLRERKKRQTLTAIHKAAMELFAARGYDPVTVTEIVAAADVSRATVFAYYPTKEDIVLGEARLAIDALAQRLDAAHDRDAVIHGVREWLRMTTGWFEPELLLQRELAEQVPAVAAARTRVLREVERVIGDAMARRLDALAAALVAAEDEAAQRIASSGKPLATTEVEALLDRAVTFVEGGLARLG